MSPGADTTGPPTGGLAAGQLISGRYALERRIAVGGMGEVWEASDERLGRGVAVKVLRAELSDDPEFLHRFRIEARTVASLNHAGVAQIHDYGEDHSEDGRRTAYLVMELVRGEPLSAVIARGPLEPAKTLRILEQAALALQAAHDRGYVHRDVKPGNILIRTDGVVKLTDFGIAKAADAIPVTRTGMVMGTAHYIAPEQASGGEAGPEGDVYSLGIVGYECLAGQRPFRAENAVAVAMMQVRDEPPPLPDTVPAPIRRLISTVLVKDPSRRYADGAEFAAAVAAIRRGEELPIPVRLAAQGGALPPLGAETAPPEDAPASPANGRRRSWRKRSSRAATGPQSGTAQSGTAQSGTPTGAPASGRTPAAGDRGDVHGSGATAAPPEAEPGGIEQPADRRASGRGEETGAGTVADAPAPAQPEPAQPEPAAPDAAAEAAPEAEPADTASADTGTPGGSTSGPAGATPEAGAGKAGTETASRPKATATAAEAEQAGGAEAAGHTGRPAAARAVSAAPGTRPSPLPGTRPGPVQAAQPAPLTEPLRLVPKQSNGRSVLIVLFVLLTLAAVALAVLTVPRLFTGAAGPEQGPTADAGHTLAAVTAGSAPSWPAAGGYPAHLLGLGEPGDPAQPAAWRSAS